MVLYLFTDYDIMIVVSIMAVMKMKNNFKQNIGCFTADFRDKKVIVAGKAFPAGHFFMNSLNEYCKEAPDGTDSNPNGRWLIGSRLLSAHLYM